MIEVANLSRRYIVQTGEPDYYESYAKESEAFSIAWSFLRAFKTLGDATAYADRKAGDFEYIQVVDKEEEK